MIARAAIIALALCFAIGSASPAGAGTTKKPVSRKLVMGKGSPNLHSVMVNLHKQVRMLRKSPSSKLRRIGAQTEKLIKKAVRQDNTVYVDLFGDTSACEAWELEGNILCSTYCCDPQNVHTNFCQELECY